MTMTINPDLRGAELAQATAEYITAHPKEWDQDLWGAKSPCGTTACVAGTAVLIADLGKWSRGSLVARNYLLSVGDAAADAFGLDFEDDGLWELFYGAWHREPDDEGGEGEHGNELRSLDDRLKEMWARVAGLFPEGAITIPPEYR